MAKRVRWRAKQLRREMAAKLGRDVKLEEVAQKTGISLSTLSYIENNKGKGVEFNTLERLAEFYQVGSVGDLLAMEEQLRAPKSAVTVNPVLT